jgi:hypothetical protein
MKIIYLFVILIYTCSISIGQELTFSFSTSTGPGNTSTITVYASKSDNMPTFENLTSFSIGFLFSSAEANILGLSGTSTNMTTTQLNNANISGLAGWASEITGSVVSISSGGFDRIFTIGITDGNGVGSNIETSPTPVAQFTFDNLVGSSSTGGTVEIVGANFNKAYTYSNTEFDEFEVMPSGSTSQALSSALPIKLTTFTAERVPDTRASLLKWTSASEENSSHIEIERSLDGISWGESIGTVKAAGNSHTAIDYEYVDRNLPLSRGEQNIFYYRLKMVDLDGSVEYSEARTVRFDEGGATMKMYPNPTADVLLVDFSAPDSETTTASLKIFDLAGKLVQKQGISVNGVTQVDMSNIAPALYNTTIEHDGHLYQKQIIKAN